MIFGACCFAFGGKLEIHRVENFVDNVENLEKRVDFGERRDTPQENVADFWGGNW